MLTTDELWIENQHLRQCLRSADAENARLRSLIGYARTRLADMSGPGGATADKMVDLTAVLKGMAERIGKDDGKAARWH